MQYHDVDFVIRVSSVSDLLRLYEEQNLALRQLIITEPSSLSDKFWHVLSSDSLCDYAMGTGLNHSPYRCAQCTNLRRFTVLPNRRFTLRGGDRYIIDGWNSTGWLRYRRPRVEGDKRTLAIIIHNILESLLPLHTLRLLTAFRCGASSYWVRETVVVPSLVDHALDVHSIVRQLLVIVEVLQQIDFRCTGHFLQPASSIGITDMPCSYQYKDVTIASSTTLVLKPALGHRMTVSDTVYGGVLSSSTSINWPVYNFYYLLFQLTREGLTLDSCDAATWIDKKVPLDISEQTVLRLSQRETNLDRLWALYTAATVV
jgi:hypothetical protein